MEGEMLAGLRVIRVAWDDRVVVVEWIACCIVLRVL